MVNNYFSDNESRLVFLKPASTKINHSYLGLVRSQELEELDN